MRFHFLYKIAIGGNAMKRDPIKYTIKREEVNPILDYFKANNYTIHEHGIGRGKHQIKNAGSGLAEGWIYPPGKPSEITIFMGHLSSIYTLEITPSSDLEKIAADYAAKQE